MNESMMTMLDQTKDLVAVLTGMRQQFIDAGWSPDAAEQMTISLFKQGQQQSKK